MRRHAPMRVAGWVMVLGIAWLGHPVAQEGPESTQSPGWDAGIWLREAKDLNTDPRILEIDLEARVASVEIAPGERLDAWTYDGGLPGPLIRAGWAIV